MLGILDGHEVFANLSRKIAEEFGDAAHTEVFAGIETPASGRPISSGQDERESSSSGSSLPWGERDPSTSWVKVFAISRTRATGRRGSVTRRPAEWTNPFAARATGS